VDIKTGRNDDNIRLKFQGNGSEQLFEYSDEFTIAITLTKGNVYRIAFSPSKPGFGKRTGAWKMRILMGAKK